MSRWRRSLDREPDGPAPFPLRPGPVGNGEFVPPAATAEDARMARLILDRVDAASRRTGIDRRRFLQSGAGVAASLAVFNACSAERRAAGGSTTTPTPSTPTSAAATTAPGGEFVVPTTVEDVVACEQALAGAPGEFVFDVHTHHVVPDGPWRRNAQRIVDMIEGLAPAGCREADPLTCLDRTSYLFDMFLASDTTVTLLSDVPNSGPDDAPLPWDEKRMTRQLADALTSPGAPRVLVHDVIAPNFGDLRQRLDGMTATASTGDVAAFKVYTAWGPGMHGYALDDPALGIPVVEHARSLGVTTICGHKGLPLLEFDPAFNGPRDLVALSRLYPDMDFVVYHGAYERETTEGPYDSGSARGIDTLVRALDDHGVGPNENVWAELGTTWREVLSHPDEAAHAVGKLLLHVGVDRVMWGTDGIWYGSPQPQLMAFRAFEISTDFQERFGYPALTPEVKAKVLGLNAAALFGVDVAATRCALDADGLTAARGQVDDLVAAGAIATPWLARGPVTRRETLAWLSSLRAPWQP